MENADLRPSLPWRRVMPGTYAAETPTGETYLVEKTDDGWRVVLRGPRGGREVLGEPSRIKWVGQCRAENHYLHAYKAKGAQPGAPEATPKRKPEPSKPAAAVAERRTTVSAGRKRGEAQASRRHRRTPPPKPEKPSKPATSAVPVDPLPAHTLAWKVSQRNGREFHVAEHEGGLFKIIEVKGAEGFALFSEPAGGVVQEIQCGSLDACKELAASMRKGKAGKAKGKAQGKEKAADKEKPDKKAKPDDKGKAESKDKVGNKSDSEPAAKSSAESGACGCDPPKPKTRAPLDEAKQAKLVDGLRSALRKFKPPTVEA